jgi:drug/metabolite transporter (DMT)-like permease
MTLAGAALVLGTDLLRHSHIGWGDLLALAASLFHAGDYLITPRCRERLPPFPYVSLMGVISALSLPGVSLTLRLPLVGYPPRHVWLLWGWRW